MAFSFKTTQLSLFHYHATFESHVLWSTSLQSGFSASALLPDAFNLVSVSSACFSLITSCPISATFLWCRKARELIFYLLERCSLKLTTHPEGRQMGLWQPCQLFICRQPIKSRNSISGGPSLELMKRLLVYCRRRTQGMTP